MRQGHAELVCIIDKSGSMESIRSDAVGGFNAFLEGQRKVPGTASVTLVLFDDQYEVVRENIDLKSVENLTDTTFVPRGSTALLDAIGRTINDVGARLSKTPEEQRPEKVMVCIVTDGLENASKEFSISKIKEMIEHQRNKYKWEFSFLAANQDAFLAAGYFGIAKQYTSNFQATAGGTKRAFDVVNACAASYRTSPNT
jgi:uncharacterized protein YegL